MQKILLSVAGAIFSLNLSACSVAIPLPGLFASSDVTRSIPVKSSSTDQPLVLDSSVAATEIDDHSSFSSAFDHNDWLAAKPALSQALTIAPGDKTGVPWYDPQTGASGRFQQVIEKSATLAQGCRAFDAQIDAYDGSHALHGHACRSHGGIWKVEEVLGSSAT